jgi:hypothetical protein
MITADTPIESVTVKKSFTTRNDLIKSVVILLCGLGIMVAKIVGGLHDWEASFILALGGVLAVYGVYNINATDWAKLKAETAQ